MTNPDNPFFQKEKERQQEEAERPPKTRVASLAAIAQEIRQFALEYACMATIGNDVTADIVNGSKIVFWGPNDTEFTILVIAESDFAFTHTQGMSPQNGRIAAVADAFRSWVADL